jgi:hypothetical protein
VGALHRTAEESFLDVQIQARQREGDPDRLAIRLRMLRREGVHDVLVDEIPEPCIRVYADISS